MALNLMTTKSLKSLRKPNSMLAKKVVEAFSYKWDDSWEDTNDIDDIVNTMVSCGETRKDIYRIIKKVKKGE